MKARSSEERLVESWSAELGDQTKTAAGEEQGGVAVVLAEDQDIVDKEQASSGGECFCGPEGTPNPERVTPADLRGMW